MKKSYEKPMIWFEDFKMSTNIASCSVDVNATDSKSCSVDVGGIKVFASATCEFSADDLDPNDICQHVPTENNNVFTS